MFSIAKIYEDISNGMSLEKIHKKYGGIKLYIPKTRPDFEELVAKEFTGDNHSVLAHKYNISIQTVYNVIKRSRKKS